ncbi:tRNA uridine-5-carboxymethylaminomethyl(34) synthesis GTPase MnmE [Arachidicoccus sp.]|uniref:tRNA uridine-5-carboxymethylaminomethyl(34) synthesis GTPase MnmE n=1 Tax=Arachidicoccus sp. TaxID=1872624 RepID=UPI003D193FFE
MYDIFLQQQDTIVAIATAQGIGAISVIRISGTRAIEITNRLFASKDLNKVPSHTLHFGLLKYKGEVIDEVVLSLFKNPHSYTGEDVIEISCHGSQYIQQEIIQAYFDEGARMALPGEFTQRAFFNGKMDLAQAEAVADLIASNSKAAQQTALKQLRGGFSNDLKILRDELISFAALIELELDFSEEDVEFADRAKFKLLIQQIKTAVNKLLQSFKLGNVIKNGVSVAIIGKPNAGKSTLLNALLNEERAIVSDIAGTTRDSIEETLNINGIFFRLIDTAGIREHSTDSIENLGIERSKQNAERARIILHIIDLTDDDRSILNWLSIYEDKTITVYNKADIQSVENNVSVLSNQMFISAKNREGMDALKDLMFQKVVGENINTENTIITNARHAAALEKISASLKDIEEGMDNDVSGDFLAIDIRHCLHYLGEITGQIEVDKDILGTIFGKFCIGK